MTCFRTGALLTAHRARFYVPCEKFMERGGIFGRCRTYPWTAGRTHRIFNKVIRLRFDDYDFTRASANVQAYNAQKLIPVFAYQCRLKTRPAPPRPGKAVVPEHWVEWQEAA